MALERRSLSERIVVHIVSKRIGVDMVIIIVSVIVLVVLVIFLFLRLGIVLVSYDFALCFFVCLVLVVYILTIRERLRDLRKVFNESSTIACETEEAMELLHILRRFPIHNCRHLLRIHGNALGRDDMTR